MPRNGVGSPPGDLGREAQGLLRKRLCGWCIEAATNPVCRCGRGSGRVCTLRRIRPKTFQATGWTSEASGRAAALRQSVIFANISGIELSEQLTLLLRPSIIVCGFLDQPQVICYL